MSYVKINIRFISKEVVSMVYLTERQITILKAIIEEYIETASPVGSETVEKKYELSVSPATIRNEMVELTKKGFLKKPHKSAGRVPTPMALKYYVANLLTPEPMPVSEEVSVKERIWNMRHQKDKLLKEAVRALSEESNMLSLALTDEGALYYAGFSRILDFPEFYDIDLTKAVLSYLDETSFWFNLYKKSHEGDPYYLIIGEEFSEEAFFPCSFLYSRFQLGSQQGAIGVVGPYRLEYRRLIPIVVYFGELINELGR